MHFVWKFQHISNFYYCLFFKKNHSIAIAHIFTICQFLYKPDFPKHFINIINCKWTSKIGLTSGKIKWFFIEKCILEMVHMSRQNLKFSTMFYVTIRRLIELSRHCPHNWANFLLNQYKRRKIRLVRNKSFKINCKVQKYLKC